MKIDIKKLSKVSLYIIIVVIVIIFLLIVRHRYNNLKEQLNQITIAHNQLSQQNQENELLISRMGDLLNITKQIILTQKNAIELGILNEKELRDKYLKEVNNVINLSEEIEILKKQGKWIDTVYIDTFNQHEWLRIPSTMLFEDKWYKANITADRTPMLNFLITYSEPTITIGIVKKGLFKKPEKITMYENANPYIQLKSIESITIKEQTKWYQTTWFKVSAGIVGGIAIMSAIK